MIHLSERASEAKGYLFIIFLIGGTLGMLDGKSTIGKFIGNGFVILIIALMIGSIIAFVIQKVKLAEQKRREDSMPLDGGFETESKVVLDKFLRFKWALYIALFILMMNLVSRA